MSLDISRLQPFVDSCPPTLESSGPGLEIVAIPLWLSSQLVWPVRPASAGLARSTCPSAPPVALEKGRRTDMDSSFPHTLRYRDGRTPAHEVPTDTWLEKPPTLATAQVLLPFQGGHRLVAQDVVVPPVLTSQMVGENPDALAITLGQQTQQLSRQANERS